MHEGARLLRGPWEGAEAWRGLAIKGLQARAVTVGTGQLPGPLPVVMRVVWKREQGAAGGAARAGVRLCAGQGQGGEEPLALGSLPWGLANATAGQGGCIGQQVEN